MVNLVQPFDESNNTQLKIESDGSINTNIINKLVSERYDYIDLNYTGDDLTEAIYKSGGSSGATVATITITYSGGNIDTVTKT